MNLPPASDGPTCAPPTGRLEPDVDGAAGYDRVLSCAQAEQTEPLF